MWILDSTYLPSSYALRVNLLTLLSLLVPDQVIPVDNIKSAVALDWDHNSNSIFWTDVERDTVNRAFLNGSSQTVIVGSNLSK